MDQIKQSGYFSFVQITGAVKILHQKLNGSLPNDLERQVNNAWNLHARVCINFHACFKFQVEMFSINNLHHRFAPEPKEFYKLDNGAFYSVILRRICLQ